MMKQSNSKGHIWHGIELVISSVLFALSCILFGVCIWLKSVFGINFQQLLYTVISPLDGSNFSIVFSGLKACLPDLAIMVLFIALGVIIYKLQKRVSITMTLDVFHWRHSFNFLNVLRHSMLFLSVASFAGSICYVDMVLEISTYLEYQMNPTTIYEERYVEPAGAGITAPQEKKNLIYIYLESMETTYASTDAGGVQATNYIPNLTELAQNNVSFSNSTQLGGWHAASGTGWTMGGLFSTTSGLPFSFPVNPNKMDAHQNFALGCTTLGDILEENGYRSMFLCGSKAAFAGRDKYYLQHGNFDISDLITARAEGYVSPDYFDGWWGYEDYILYGIAKDKLLQLAQSDEPFNFTMLTVDTHFPEGHPCPRCQTTYDSVAACVVSCADRQIAEFIEWCTQQDFYEDTIIVITGDHPRMDTKLVEGLANYDRTVYNCFINCPVPDGARLTNREFTAMDIFPTVLSALGFDYEGDQLGLGVDLFSDASTLSEQMGYQAFNLEISKYSPYFTEYFSEPRS